MQDLHWISLMRIAFAILLALSFAHLHAATLSVDTTSDSADLTACTTAAADCPLRGAITASNVLAGVDTIEFNIPTIEAGFDGGTGICRIGVASDLPTIL